MKKFTKYPSSVKAATETPVKELTVTLKVKLEKYDSTKPGDFEFFVDTNEVGELVLTPYDKNIHFVEGKVE